MDAVTSWLPPLFLRLAPWLAVRGSGGDLRTFFYQIREHERNLRRRASGRPFSGAQAAGRGLDPARTYRLALAVIAMGGANSADIAQEVHEAILRAGDALDEDVLLVYGRPLPSGSLLLGIYLDDFGVVHIARRSLAALPTGPDADLVHRIHRAYDLFNVPPGS